MREIVGSTSEEIRMCKAIQKSTGALANGVIGNQTLSDIANFLNADCFPLNVELYGQPCIIAKNIEPMNPKCKLPVDSISGSFNDSYQPCSIFIANKRAQCWCACHWTLLGKPETVIYKEIDGKDEKILQKRVGHISMDLHLGQVEWAVGGMGLLDFYDPEAEGFTGKFSDVLRKTNHTVLGYRNGLFYGVYFKNMTASKINQMCKEKFKFEMAILLDGGHIAAINAAVNKINVNQRQLYSIKFF